MPDPRGILRGSAVLARAQAWAPDRNCGRTDKLRAVSRLAERARHIDVAIAQFWPHWAVIWIVPAIFFVGQTLSDYLLSPYFVGRRVNLNPVWIMFALFAFGYLFGFVGLLIAVPLASAIGVLTRFALQRYYESFLYTAIPRATVTDSVRLTPSDKKMD